VHVVSISDLASKVNISNYEDSLKKVKSKFSNGSSNSDIQEVTNSLRMSLKCPLTFGRIKTPVRGKHCSHIQCFDLSSYLTMNQSYPKFTCPVCSKPANYEDLTIDSFVNNILEKSSLEDEEVDVFPDCTWARSEKKTTLKRKPEVKSVTSLPPQKIADYKGIASFSTNLKNLPLTLNNTSTSISPIKVKKEKEATSTPKTVFIDLTL
jgi:hypothetical protein